MLGDCESAVFRAGQLGRYGRYTKRCGLLLHVELAGKGGEAGVRVLKTPLTVNGIAIE